MRSLSTQKTNIRATSSGFTIVELLIVIVVIGILAAITIVAFNGIKERAIEATMQSDLRNATNTLEIDYANDGIYPATADDANGGNGLQASGGNRITYLGGGASAFCIKVTNPGISTSYHVSSTDKTVASGSCGIWVTTLAGSGTGGCTDATGSAASFSYDYGVTVDDDGVVYVASTYCGKIRKVTPAGVVTTLAGQLTLGFNDATGSAAQFQYPYKLDVDSAGNIYVGDSDNHRVRKVTQAGVVTTFAGSGVSGGTDGTGTGAQLSYPGGIAVDDDDNVYVAEGVGRIRKITPAGVVTTVAGNGTDGFVDANGTAARFDSPQAIAVDSSGVLYVADTYNHAIRRIAVNGDVTTIAGSGSSGDANGTGAAAEFSYPNGIAVDASGNIYVTDSGNNLIRKVTQAGVVTTVIGDSAIWEHVDGPIGTGQLNYPVDVAVDQHGSLYIMDNGSFSIRRIDL